MLSVLALQLWEQNPNICPLLTVLHDGQEGTLENLQAIRLLGGKTKSESNADGIVAELTVCGRGLDAYFCPGSLDVGAEGKHSY